MQQFIEKYRAHINGVLSGFDRLIFRGLLRRLHYGRWNEANQVMVAKGNGRVSLAEQDPVQRLCRRCQKCQRAIEEGVGQSV